MSNMNKKCPGSEIEKRTPDCRHWMLDIGKNNEWF